MENELLLKEMLEEAREVFEKFNKLQMKLSGFENFNNDNGEYLHEIIGLFDDMIDISAETIKNIKFASKNGHRRLAFK